MGRIIIVYEHERSSNIRLLHASNTQNKNEKKMKQNDVQVKRYDMWSWWKMRTSTDIQCALLFCLSVWKFYKVFFITWTVLSFLIWYAFTQFSRQTTIIQQKKHVEKKDYWNFRNHVIIKCFTSFISTL